MKYSILITYGLLLLGADAYAQSSKPIYSSEAYTIYPDRVIQGKYTAKALSANELMSDYLSPATLHKSPAIDFKFSINGKDNERTSGSDHRFNALAQNNETPLLVFGQDYVDTKPIPADVYLKPSSTMKIRLDMRPVFESFQQKGYYICYNGEKLYKTDFKAVYVAGNTAPMIWDFNNLVNHPELELKDPDQDHIYELTLVLNKPQDENRMASKWKLSRDLSAFPKYHSNYKITDALYNLALEEMQHAVEPDSTFRTGKEWSGVWTRDISYSIILSMAILQPKVAVYSLMKKVKNGRIIQDTGTGGAYPVSSDRMIWAVAAYEVYKVTGDKSWLEKAYPIIKKSAEDDYLNIYDRRTGLVRGESSFLDWREETYPRWMQPVDIYESECLGTNVVHYQVDKVLASMAALLGEKADEKTFTSRAASIKAGLEALWLPAKGYYGQFLYGRNFKTVSPRSEALGEALAVLFNTTDDKSQQSIVASTPVNNFGIPCIFPQIPGILPYHNKAVWPFVEAYWAMASAKVGNETSLLRAISAIYRPAALFLTNKENYVVDDGDYAGTQINSSNMLWSLSGNIALVYKVLFGMQFNENNLQFKPFVPKALAGTRTLNHFKYRDAILNISMQGYGNEVSSILLDGKAVSNGTIPDDLKGIHTLKIVLANKVKGGKSNLQATYTSPEMPLIKYDYGRLSWDKVAAAVAYHVVKDGKSIATIKGTTFEAPASAYGSYQVAAIDAQGIGSFYSEPLEVVPVNALQTIELEQFATPAELRYEGYTGSGFVEISKLNNKVLTIPLGVEEAGIYAVTFRYANGNGPINTENKCAIRSLEVDQQFAGTVVLPQRGKAEWSNWGYSNTIQVNLTKGKHVFSLLLKEANENMNGAINQAMIDNVRVVKIQAN